MNASIYDVAQRSGVSIATVSRVLNHSGNVREQTVEKVRKAMQELNYSENLLAKGLAASRTGLRDLHITFSHDDYRTNVGGVQLCLQIESARVAEQGRDPRKASADVADLLARRA